MKKNPGNSLSYLCLMIYEVFLSSCMSSGGGNKIKTSQEDAEKFSVNYHSVSTGSIYSDKYLEVKRSFDKDLSDSLYVKVHVSIQLKVKHDPPFIRFLEVFDSPVSAPMNIRCEANVAADKTKRVIKIIWMEKTKDDTYKLSYSIKKSDLSVVKIRTKVSYMIDRYKAEAEF